jgi:hypothetical protein
VGVTDEGEDAEDTKRRSVGGRLLMRMQTHADASSPLSPLEWAVDFSACPAPLDVRTHQTEMCAARPHLAELLSQLPPELSQLPRELSQLPRELSQLPLPLPPLSLPPPPRLSQPPEPSTPIAQTTNKQMAAAIRERMKRAHAGLPLQDLPPPAKRANFAQVGECHIGR